MNSGEYGVRKSRSLLTLTRSLLTHRAAVNSGEYGVSRAILESGYSLTSLNSEFAHTDLSLAENWYSLSGTH